MFSLLRKHLCLSLALLRCEYQLSASSRQLVIETEGSQHKPRIPLWACFETHAHGSLTPFLISHKLMGTPVQCPRNIPIYAMNKQTQELPSSPQRTYLHHPPICHRRHGQLPFKYGDLEDGHPCEKTDFKEDQGQEVSFRGADECFNPVIARHGRNGVVLEDDAKCNRKRKVCRDIRIEAISGARRRVYLPTR